MGEISDTLRNPLSMFDVKGRTAVVTGASGAFGRGVSIALGALGANVVMASGTKEDLDEAVADVKDVGGNAIAVYRRPDTLEDAEGHAQSRP